jgi:hypothetical protein
MAINLGSEGVSLSDGRAELASRGSRKAMVSGGQSNLKRGNRAGRIPVIA